jgi:hypothetical protein
MATAPPVWLVKGVFARSGLAMLFGESSAGKTFMAIHLALCVAWGLPFFGRRVQQGAVLYVAAEGGASVIVRFKAAEKALRTVVGAANLSRKADGLPPLVRAPIRIITESPDLSPEGSAAPLVATVNDAAQDLAANGDRLAMVIGDTWHAMLAGAEENSSADVGKALRPLRDLSDAHGFMTLLLHHPGKMLEKGARGSNAFHAAMDTVVELRVPGHEGQQAKRADALRRATVTKLRDGDVGTAFAYRLPVVEIGRDEDGDALTTCTVQPVADDPVDVDGATSRERAFWEAFNQVQHAGRASAKSVRGAFRHAHPKMNPDAARKACNRGMEDAERGGRVVIDPIGDDVFLPSAMEG